MLPTLLIFFRESLEASLIVGIIIAYLKRVGRGDVVAAVWAGVALAVLVDVGVAVATYHVIQDYDGSRMQTILEGTTYFVATGMLTYMSFWMKAESRNLKRSLETRLAAVLTRGSWLALVLLPALTVGREGLETVFFTLAVAFSASPLGLAGGAALGLAGGLSVSYAMYRLGRRVPLGLFFNVLGVLLLLFAAGLLADGIQDYQALAWLPGGNAVLWHSTVLLGQSTTVGDLLHAFFGYTDRPTVLQFTVWAVFLGGSVARYLRRGKPPGPASRIPAGERA